MTSTGTICYAVSMRRTVNILVGVALVLLCSFGTAVGEGLDLGVPRLTPNLPADMLGQPQQAMTSGGVECGPGKEVCVSPLVGVDHRKRETTDSATSLIHHDFNVRAGWRLSLFDALQVSTSAKLPLVSAEQRQGVMAGDQRSGATTKIKTAEQPLTSVSGVTWGSDVLLKINNRFNLNLFYDYSKGAAGTPQGQPDKDERFGTRLEYKFK